MLQSVKIKLGIILILTISFSFISCEKGVDEEDVNPPPVANSIFLKTIIKDIDEFTFIYDSINRLTKFEYGEVNSSVVGYYTFEYLDNKLMHTYQYSMGYNTGKMIFSNHNSLGLPEKAAVYYDYGNGNGFELSQMYNYFYQGDKLEKVQRVKMVDGVEVLINEKRYFYENNNMVKQENYYMDNDSLKMASFYEYSFDNAYNPGMNMGLPKIDFLGVNFDEYFMFPSISTMNKNNYTARKEYDNNGDLRELYSIKRSIEYYSNNYIYKSTTTNTDNSFRSNSEYRYY